MDRGTTQQREVSVNIFTGSPSLGTRTGAISQHVALPCSGLTFRHLFLPKASKSVRQQVVAEELAYSLPFPLTDAHYGIVEHAEQAWVAIASRRVVEPVKELFPRSALEVEPLCYLRAAKAARIQDALVIDFGASKTVFCGIENGEVGTVRVLLRGGVQLTKQLAETLGLNENQAEVRKREEGCNLRDVRQFYLELLDEALLPSPLPYRQVLICGGGSATPGLLKLLSDQWGADAEPFPLPDDLLPTDHVIAFGAALAGRLGAVKLRMEHSSRQGDSREGNTIAVIPIVFIALIAGFMILSVETRLREANLEQAELTQTLTDAVKPTLPKASTLKPSEIVKELKDQIDQQKIIARNSPGRIMTSLGRGSDAITSKKGATLYSIIFEEGQLKLEGRAKEIKQVEDIRKDLEPVLSDVEVVKTRPNQQTFVYEIRGALRD